MIALIRLAIFGFIAMTVVYFAVSIYSRSVRREKLEDTWDEENSGRDDKAARDAYIEAGMKEYENGLRKKLIWLVYVIPTVAIIALIYFINFY
ncbi:hypothetical protein [Aliiroseovarius sp. YM-037]|uniref:hypothetical protein n=1 Tax=Aliiroseovarius sp. YM-037 TaxID=3341728 RepID=UPI003A806AAA